VQIKYKHTPPWYASIIGDVYFDHKEHRWTAAEIGDVDFERECPESKKTSIGILTPEIVVLCGSTRFWQTFQDESLRLTLEGRIYLSVGAMTASDKDHGITAEQKVMLDELHKRKIDLADRVHVLNVGGYVGDSTRSEIEYATMLGKPITWLEEP
jgi:hypothetical protein